MQIASMHPMAAGICDKPGVIAHTYWDLRWLAAMRKHVRIENVIIPMHTR